jgi:hypothetical protein
LRDGEPHLMLSSPLSRQLTLTEVVEGGLFASVGRAHAIAEISCSRQDATSG